MIWTHGKESLEQFHENLNAYHPTIKLTLEHSDKQVHFLDTIIKFNGNHLQSTVYRKPTDRNSYLHASSFHPPHTTRSIVYSQALRYNRICSDRMDRDNCLAQLQKSFLDLKYNPRSVADEITKAKSKPRDDLLQYQPRDSQDRIPLVATYSPALKPLLRIINELNPILRDDDTLKQIFKEKPIVAYKQPPNLRAHLVRSSLTPPTNNGTIPCNRPRCQLCPHINTNMDIMGPNNTTYSIKGSFDCTSTNIVYAITCKLCPTAVYIGQTGQSLRQRMNSHKFDIRNKNIEKPVAEHFNLPGHSLSQLTAAVLQQRGFKDRMQREAAEQKLINKLDCINGGLNRDRGFLSHYTSDSSPFV